jgi:hypothetical protein
MAWFWCRFEREKCDFSKKGKLLNVHGRKSGFEREERPDAEDIGETQK